MNKKINQLGISNIAFNFANFKISDISEIVLEKIGENKYVFDITASMEGVTGFYSNEEDMLKDYNLLRDYIKITNEKPSYVCRENY